jgi:hypothetical protein
MAALLILAQTGSNQDVLWWRKKLWSIQTMEYQSLLKSNAEPSHRKTYRALQCILLSERSLFEEASLISIL